MQLARRRKTVFIPPNMIACRAPSYSSVPPSRSLTILVHAYTTYDKGSVTSAARCESEWNPSTPADGDGLGASAIDRDRELDELGFEAARRAARDRAVGHHERQHRRTTRTRELLGEQHVFRDITDRIYRQAPVQAPRP